MPLSAAAGIPVQCRAVGLPLLLTINPTPDHLYVQAQAGGLYTTYRCPVLCNIST